LGGKVLILYNASHFLRGEQLDHVIRYVLGLAHL
jgi:hypothetical protein